MERTARRSFPCRDLAQPQPAKKLNKHRAATVNAAGQGIAVHLHALGILQIGKGTGEPVGVKRSGREEIKIDRDAVPQAHSKGSPAVEGEMIGRAIQLGPQPQLRCGKDGEVGGKDDHYAPSGGKRRPRVF